VTTAPPAALDAAERPAALTGRWVARRLSRAAAAWWRRHARSLAVLLPVLAVVGVVHAVGMAGYPRWVDDPGTYLSQAWSVRYEHALSPYSYFYDHAPAGWMQIGLWAAVTDGFQRYGSAVGFGNECMLLAKLASGGLLYVLGRRLGLGRPGAAVAVVLFGLSPLALTYTRWTFLDNLVTPWLLLSFVLAYSPRRSIGAASGAALSFAMATLTKETALVVLPAFCWAMMQNLDRRNRAPAVAVAAFGGLLLMAMYPLYALYKGELLPGAGHNSLLGTARWQLLQRQASGSVLDPHSQTRQLLNQWLGLDRYLLLAGLAAVPVALLATRLRPVALALGIQWLMLVRGGYVPFMHVVTLLPWSALVLVGAVEVLAGNPAVLGSRSWPGRWLGRPPRRLRVAVAGLVAVPLTVAATLSWTPQLRQMTAARQAPPLLSATGWLADNVPRDRVLVVHDSIWVDLVQHYGFSPQPVMAYKLDTDPAVRRSLRRIDYLVVPDWYYTTPDAASKYPTLLEARKHAVPVAHFGAGSDGVRIYRVSRYWRPR
jgi:hypothetical protein